jgi:hypothetical protein
MGRIGNVGIKIENYFHDSYQKCANLDFTEDAIKAFRSVAGLPTSTETELYRDIDEYIETFTDFLFRWETSRNIDKKTIKLGKNLHNELLKLKDYIEDTPSDMMMDIMNIIMQKSLRGY